MAVKQTTTTTFANDFCAAAKNSGTAIPKPEGGVWVDMGGGTGANIENFGDEICKLSKIYVVDLSGSLLKIATDRFQQRGWTNVEAVEADATKFRPPEGQADVVTFSYSLTMIPDWFAAIENAFAMLKPGGLIGVVDFYVGRKYPAEGLKKHGWLVAHALAPLVCHRQRLSVSRSSPVFAASF